MRSIFARITYKLRSKTRRDCFLFDRYKINSEIYRTNIEKYALVNTVEKYVYFRVPKNANTTVTASLLSNKPLLNQKGIRKHQFETVYDLNIDKINFDKYCLFAVIRNPYSRILSVYLQKVMGGGSKSAIVSKATGLEEHSIKFEEFVSYLEDGGLDRNGHWIPQHKIIPIEYIPQIHLIRFENIDYELNRLFLEKIPGAKMTVENQHATGADKKLDLYYNDNLYERVNNLYSKDFDLFKY